LLATSEADTNDIEKSREPYPSERFKVESFQYDPLDNSQYGDYEYITVCSIDGKTSYTSEAWFFINRDELEATGLSNYEFWREYEHELQAWVYLAFKNGLNISETDAFAGGDPLNNPQLTELFQNKIELYRREFKNRTNIHVDYSVLLRKIGSECNTLTNNIPPLYPEGDNLLGFRFSLSACDRQNESTYIEGKLYYQVEDLDATGLSASEYTEKYRFKIQDSLEELYQRVIIKTSEESHTDSFLELTDQEISSMQRHKDIPPVGLTLVMGNEKNAKYKIFRPRAT
jgi:hypothetical protein